MYLASAIVLAVGFVCVAIGLQRVGRKRLGLELLFLDSGPKLIRVGIVIVLIGLLLVAADAIS
jgi:hypothetical protein